MVGTASFSRCVAVTVEYVVCDAFLSNLSASPHVFVFSRLCFVPPPPPPLFFPFVPRWLLTLVAVHRAELFKAQEQCFSESSGLLIVVKMLLYVAETVDLLGTGAQDVP